MRTNDDDNKELSGSKRIEIPSFVNQSSEMNQLSGKIKKRTDDIDDSSSFVREVNSSLARQVQNNMDAALPKPKRQPPKKKRKRNVFKTAFITLLSLIFLSCILVFTPLGKSIIARIATEYIYGNLDYQATSNMIDDGTDSNGKEPVDKIVNILLIGIEEIKNAKNTDSMIVATMNTENHSLKLTSLMRDLYVDIPGHDRGRLNSAYARGGIELLYSTIEQNFGIKINGYCMVNFESFQQIVDLVGGVDVTLTQKEADYLNSTNYISEKKYRTVISGTQTLNGNQALGYCRVRKKPTATESDDFGRTQRQRIVLKAIYDKVRSKNIVEMVVLMDKILNEIKPTTDVTKSEFSRYLEEAMNLKVKELETLRIPTNGSYENVTVKLGKVNQEVLQPKDWDATRAEINDFINGTASGTETAADNETATGIKDENE